MHSVGITVHIYLWHTENLNKWRWTVTRAGVQKSGETNNYFESLNQIGILIDDYEREKAQETSKESGATSTERVGERSRIPALT